MPHPRVVVDHVQGSFEVIGVRVDRNDVPGFFGEEGLPRLVVLVVEELRFAPDEFDGAPNEGLGKPASSRSNSVFAGRLSMPVVSSTVSVVIAHHPFPHCVRFAHAGFVRDMRGLPSLIGGHFTAEAAVDQDRHSGLAMAPRCTRSQASESSEVPNPNGPWKCSWMRSRSRLTLSGPPSRPSAMCWISVSLTEMGRSTRKKDMDRDVGEKVQVVPGAVH